MQIQIHHHISLYFLLLTLLFRDPQFILLLHQISAFECHQEGLRIPLPRQPLRLLYLLLRHLHLLLLLPHIFIKIPFADLLEHDNHLATSSPSQEASTSYPLSNSLRYDSLSPNHRAYELSLSTTEPRKFFVGISISSLVSGHGC